MQTFPVIYNKDVKVPIYAWLPIEKIEPDAFKQAKNLANLPFAFHHVAIMPDTHVGFGMPIGAILATKGVVIPNAVGVDIGCGMRALKTNLSKDQVKRRLDDLLYAILNAVPTGFEWYPSAQKHKIFSSVPDIQVVKKALKRAKKQLGTLGSGNHFIEIQYDTDGLVWVMLHSGSRNLGKRIADFYYRKAREFTLASKYAPGYPSLELAFLPLDSQLGQEYWEAMEFAMAYAKANRETMMNTIKSVFHRLFPGVDFKLEIDVHHNYASIEKHFGETVVVHRKGATYAGKGSWGIIPGSMGTKSYIVKGKGAKKSFMSCSHGAGRVMGRKEALRKIPKDKVLADMERLGIKIAKKKLYDIAEESRFVYKDIDEVIRYQRDLVDVAYVLYPMGVVKG